METDPNPRIELLTRNVLQVTYKDITAGWEKWILLSSDRHHDNIHCRQDIEKRHLEMALKREADIFDFGDLFCAMQGKYDPRSNMDDIRPENVKQNYLDSLVETAGQFYGPYASRFKLIAKGNHETNITKRHGTDLTSNLVNRLNTDFGGRVFTGEYGGWIKFKFYIHQTVRVSKNLKYFHGAGGGGPVTRGVIQTNRQAVYLPDADIVVNGHTHDSYHVPIARERLSQAGVVRRDVVHYLRTASYKDEYGDGGSGWHVERGGPPKPIGAIWGRFYLENTQDYTIGFDVIQDVV